MNIWLVSPAWKRPAVTRLALTQRRWLCDELAARGHEAHSVIVASDVNLQVARELGFDAVEYPNADLGMKFNVGYKYAADQGAELLVHIGSDDWIHPDVFNILERVDLTQPPHDNEWLPPEKATVYRHAPQVVAMRKATIADLVTGRLQRLSCHGSKGVIPWLIPRCVLEPNGFMPIPPGHKRGIDGALARSLRTRPNWLYQPAEDDWLVDFKSRINITAYKDLVFNIGTGPELDGFDALRAQYPDGLVDMAWETSQTLTRAAA